MFDYGAIARQDVIIAQYAAAGGNFDVVVADILKQVSEKNAQLAYRDGSHTYFLLHDDTNLNIIIAGSPSAQTQDANELLSKIQRTFLTNPSVRTWREVPPYGLQNEFSDHIRDLMTSMNTQIERRSRPAPIEPELELMHTHDSVLLETDEQTGTERVFRRGLWSVVYSHRYWAVGVGVGLVVIIIIVVAVS